MDVVTLGIASADARKRFAPVARGRIVELGDSHLQLGGYNGPSAPAANPLNRDEGAYSWAEPQLGGRARIVNNAGVGGEKSTEILARFGTGVRPFSPGTVIVSAGTNDIKQLVTDTATRDSTLALLKSNIGKIIDLCKGIGATVVLTTVPPVHEYTTIQNEAKDRYNRWLKELPLYLTGVYTCDWAARVQQVDNGRWKAGYSTDGTHGNSLGCAVMGADLATVLRSILPPVDVMPTCREATDLLQNGFQIGTTGTISTGVTGVTADQWSASADGASTTTVASKVARTDGLPGEWQQLAVSAGTGVRYLSTFRSGWAVGDTIEMLCEFESDANLTPTGSTFDSYFSVQVIGTTGISQTLKNVAANPYTDPRQFFRSAIFRTPPFVIPVGTTLMRAEYHLVAATGTVRIGRVSPRKIA